MQEAPIEIERNRVKYIRADEVAKQMQRLLKESVRLENRVKELEKQVRERNVWEHCFVSDLHCGSLWFDAPAFNRIIKKLYEDGVKCRYLHILGDVVEGKFNHTGQLYEAFPFPIQRSLAVKTIKRLVSVLKPREMHIIPGNHDRKYAFNLLDIVVEDLKKELDNVKIHYYRDDDYYVVHNILLLHGITRSAGSDYTGITPLIQNNIIPLALENNANIVVLGHYHRSVIVQYMGRIIIVLPSFQYASKPLRNGRGLVLLKDRDTVKIVRTRPSKRSELIEYWRKVVKV